ncbi:hypothetical protein C2E23DRAFT_491578 [Lenzites betulinus]|nr:hypothetical protein C2E23DRAFT_491578 [Lenzites betulinus]
MVDVLVGNFYGGAGTGALGGPPSGHNYKRAVYRAPPKDFTVEVLPPTKFGSGYCYGMHVISLHSDASDSRSTKSSASFSDYEVWRRWEDCLWFQEILESEYALMARQKRARLAAGKGVKKNGVYIHSDQAASFDSLPPGPDANMIAKDIHALLPRLTKKGTLFRASQATIDQRGREFEALITTFFSPDLPTLVQELRETRLCRDFFGYWRRDLDHDRKRGKVRPDSVNANGALNPRSSVASSAFSMYFSASNISLQLPNAFSDLPPSPPYPSMQQTSRPNSMVRDDRMRPPSFGMAPGKYAPSESSASSASSASSHSPQSPPMAPQDMTFFVSDRGSLALSVPEDHADVEYLSVPLSAPAMQPSWTQDPSRPFPSTDDSEDSEDAIFVTDNGKHWADGPSSADFHHNLQALPEDRELVTQRPSAAHSAIEEIPRVPGRRQRNNSCPDRANRNCLVFLPEGPHSAGPTNREFSPRDRPTVNTQSIQDEHRRPESTNDPHTPSDVTNSSRTSSMVFSAFDKSQRSSWSTSRASMISEVSETSYAPSFTSSFTNGSCADFGRPRIGSPDSRYSVASTASAISIPDVHGDGRDTVMGHQHRESIATIGSMLSEFSIDSSILPRSLTPPVGSHMRRSLSAGSRRGLTAPGAEEYWYEQQDDLIDAYFYDPGMIAPPARPEAEVQAEAELEPPLTPARKPPPELFNLEAATPDRFPKPFRDRPPGQFHLPWSPQESSYPTSPSSVPALSPSSPPAHAYASPASPAAHPTSPTATESVTLKAVLHDSIVLVRIARGASLLEVRDRLREKFAVQEGVRLLPSFVIGWAPPVPPTRGGPNGVLALRGRPRSNSASSVGSLNPQALRYLYSEQDWQTVLTACAGGKMTVRLFNAQPI